MRRERGELDIVIAIVATLISVAVLLTAIYIMSGVYCGAQWEKSGMRSEFGAFTGCLVEVEPGRWIPAERVREIEIPRKSR